MRKLMLTAVFAVFVVAGFAMFSACGSSSDNTCGLGGFKCANNKAYTCNTQGTWNIADCGKALGMTCETTNTGAHCIPLGPDETCGLGGFQCVDNKAYNCGTANKWVVTDCSLVLGETCQMTNAGASCVPLVAPKECGLGGFKCEDNKAYTCGTNEMWQMTADCSASIGTTCTLSSSGAACTVI